MINIVTICAKVSDGCYFDFKDDTGKTVAEGRDYVPDFFPDEHYGDYIMLDIDMSTGKIVNWKKPTQAQIKKAMKGLS